MQALSPKVSQLACLLILIDLGAVHTQAFQVQPKAISEKPLASSEIGLTLDMLQISHQR